MENLAVRQSFMRSRLRWLSLTPIDQSTPAGRAQERHRRVALTAAASALAKVVSVGSALISVPLTLHYLGAERFGMWMTISSLIAMLAFADFGIGNGVLNTVASAHGRDDGPAIRRAVSSGFFLLLAVALGLVLLFAGAYPWVPWADVFNVRSELARAEAGPALAVFVMCFAANIPLAVAQRSQMGLQQGFAASLWQCLGSVCGLAGVLFAIRLELGLPWLVLALAGAPLLAMLINSLHFLLIARPDLRPSLAQVSAVTCRQVANTGALFFVLQVVVAVAYTSDSLLIAQHLGASAVAEYAVPEKLFALISMAVAMMLAPFWPAYGEAMSRGDSAWIRATLRRTFFSAVGLAAVGSALLVATGPSILKLWVSNAVEPTLMLLVAFGVWKVLEAGGFATAMFLNGAQVIGLQLWCAVPTALLAITLKLLLIPQLGVAGAVWASIIAFSLCTVLPVALRLPVLLRTTHPQPA